MGGQIRSTNIRFGVILYLFCGQHDFSDNKKIICEALRLLISLFGNRGYEQSSVKPNLEKIVQRCHHITKFYRENKIEGAVAEEIIVKVAQLTSYICENPNYRNFIVNEMKNMDLLRHYCNDIQHCPQDSARWCHSARLLFNIQNEIKDFANDAFWHKINQEIKRRNIAPPMKQNYQQNPTQMQQEYWNQSQGYPPHPEYGGNMPPGVQYNNNMNHPPQNSQNIVPNAQTHQQPQNHSANNQTYMEMQQSYPNQGQMQSEVEGVQHHGQNHAQMEPGNQMYQHVPVDPFQNMPNIETSDMNMGQFEITGHEMGDLNWFDSSNLH